MADMTVIDRMVAHARSSMLENWDNPKVAAAAALDAVTIPLLMAVEELRAIRELLEHQHRA